MSLNSNLTIEAKTSNYMREMSVWMYCFHSFTAMIISQLLPMEIENSFVMYLIFAAVVTLIAYLIAKVRLMNKSKKSSLSVQN